MRWVYRLALTLAVIAPLHAPAFAAEPEAPAVLIGATEAIRIAIQNRLSAKFTAASNARKSEQGALVEFYSRQSTISCGSMTKGSLIAAKW
jgi:hypothetical protein